MGAAAIRRAVKRQELSAAPHILSVKVPRGEPLGRRYLYWNFVSSRRERLVQAAADWEAQRFPTVPGETEFIPLPAQRPTAD